MSHKDYRNYSKQFNRENVQEQVVTTTSPAIEAARNAHTHTENEIPPVLDATVPVPDETNVEATTVEAAPELPITVAGVVSGCKKLNVRNKPSTTAAILTTVNEGAEVVIDQRVQADAFYKVTLANGTIGYCMKKFITVK